MASIPSWFWDVGTLYICQPEIFIGLNSFNMYILLSPYNKTVTLFATKQLTLNLKKYIKGLKSWLEHFSYVLTYLIIICMILS